MARYTTFAYGGDGQTSIVNTNLIGEVYEVSELLEGRAGKSFCDGQTSVTTPRYADDNMMNLYFSTEAAALAASGFLRGEVRSDIASGALTIDPLPYWATEEFTVNMMAAAVAVTLAEEVRRAFSTDEVTDAQLTAAAESFVVDNGYAPTAAELLEWIDDNRNW